jgi:hypothetical protein
MSNKFGWISIIAIIPFIVLFESAKRMTETYTGIGGSEPEAFVFQWQLALWIMSGLFALFLSWYYSKSISKSLSLSKVSILAIAYLGFYVLVCNMISGTWLKPFSSQHLYVVNMVVIFFLIRKHQDITSSPATSSYTKPMLKYWSICLAILLLLSLVAVQFGIARHKEGRWKVTQTEEKQTNVPVAGN